MWLAVLSRASLSFAYPFASLTYVLILLADRFVLHEQIPPLRWAGVFCIMLGIVLVAQTPHSMTDAIPGAAELGRRHRELQHRRTTSSGASRPSSAHRGDIDARRPGDRQRLARRLATRARSPRIRGLA